MCVNDREFQIHIHSGFYLFQMDAYRKRIDAVKFRCNFFVNNLPNRQVSMKDTLGHNNNYFFETGKNFLEN